MSVLRKIVGFPFSLVWDLVSRFRNFLYDEKYLKSQSFDLPIIGVGNLSMGGTGKTPHVEYLIQLFRTTYPTAVLSRGYRRKTSGYRFATKHSTAKEIGDEPMQYHLKYPDVAVAVSENRIMGIPSLLMDAPQTQLILLDDVFQHRQVKPGLQILLTDYKHRFSKDMIFPSGDLRESSQGKERANIVIVTKSPNDITEQEAESIKNEFKLTPDQSLYFTTFHYGQPYSFFDPEVRLEDVNQEVLLVTGIAKPEYLKSYLSSTYSDVFSLDFPDHYNFTDDDIERISQAYTNLGNTNKTIIITEKDAVKLIPFRYELQKKKVSLFIQPIQVKFLFNKTEQFNREAITFVQNFYYDQSIDPNSGNRSGNSEEE